MSLSLWKAVSTPCGVSPRQQLFFPDRFFSLVCGLFPFIPAQRQISFAAPKSMLPSSRFFLPLRFSRELPVLRLGLIVLLD